MQNNIRFLLHPRSIALLGCSENNAAGTVLANLLHNKYSGDIYPVHPRHEQVLGLKCYKNLQDIPGEVDVCLVGLRSDLVLNSIEEMHQKGVPAAVFLASGFSETGEEGRLLERQVSEKLSEYKIAACGPNCLGLINVNEGATLYSAACEVMNSKGRIGVVSHSGSVCIALSSAARGEGFSYLISCGNEAGLSVADYFKAMIEEDSTEIVVGFLETIRDPKGLEEAAKLAIERNKPIVILKVGKSEIAQETASAHSGALASSSDVNEAFFQKHGILEVDSFDELSEVCELLIKIKDHPRSSANEIALTAISGGQLGFCCDAAYHEGVAIGEVSEATKNKLADILPSFATPKNPLDVTTALFSPSDYQACIKALLDDDAVGLLMVCQDSEAKMFDEEIDLYRKIIEAIRDVKSEVTKPIVVFSPLSAGLIEEFQEILAEENIPLLQGTHESMVAVKKYFQWLQILEKGAIKSEDRKKENTDYPFPDRKHLSEHESKNLLRLYEIDVAKDVLVQNANDAVEAAEQIGYPVVLKVDTAEIPHKTEADIIRLNLNSETELLRAYDEIVANAKKYDPQAILNGVSVQEMVPKGVEILIGGKVDATFGPTVMVGLGGTFVEVFKDYSLKLAPINMETAYEMIDSLKGSALLYGVRGREKADVDALAGLIVKVSHLMYDQSDKVSELDINPVIVHKEGAGLKAVDALVVLKKE